MSLEMSAPTGALPGQTVEILLVATNPSSEVANYVRIRNRLPAALILVAAEADENGIASVEIDSDGATVVLFDWLALAPGASAEATLTVQIAEDTRAGDVIDNLAVALADNGASATAGVSIGLPPAILPGFN